MLKESGEMYLETIYVLQRDNADVHPVMVAQKLGISKPSVSRALGILMDSGFIFIDSNNHIQFTDKGKEYAVNLFEKHKVSAQYLQLLGVDTKTAEDDACRIEHVISDATFGAIKQALQKKNANEN